MFNKVTSYKHVLDPCQRYLQHPTVLVSNAAHALFVHFLGLESLGTSSDRTDASKSELGQVSLREKLSVYYVERALEVLCSYNVLSII